MKKTQKGFTLVELIVVLAIIGVLAAILVPVLLGWIRKTKLKTANEGAHKVFEAVRLELQDKASTGTNVTTFAGCASAGGTGVYTASLDTIGGLTTKDAIQDTVYSTLYDSKKGNGSAEVAYQFSGSGDSFDVDFAQFKAQNSNLIGQYPDEVQTIDKADTNKGAAMGTKIV